MKKRNAKVITGAAAALWLALMFAAGCGGGGPNTPSGPGTVNAQFTQLLPAVQRSAARVGAAKCAACHTTLHTGWMATQHAKALVDCESCHGPGSVHIANPVADNILHGTDSANSLVCGQCHSQETSDWSASKHAQIVADPVNTASNNCLRCHSGEFGATNVSEPLSQGQTPDQIHTAITSLSSTALMAYVPVTTTSATCTSCHDPHQNTNSLTSASEQFYLRRDTSSTDLSSDQPGATVASYTTVNHICGSCHNNRGGNPADAALNKNTTRPATHEGPEYNMLLGYGGAEDVAGPPKRTSSHATVPDQCVQCHMPNARHTFTVSLDTSCAPCHTPADAASRETTLQTQVQNDLVALRTRMQNWAQATFGDPNVWDYTSNIPATSNTPDETKVPIQVKRARHNYYFILLDRSSGVHNANYTNYLLNYANTGLDALGISRVQTRAMSRQERISILNSDILKVRSANLRSLGN